MPFKLGRKPRLFGPTLHWSSLQHLRATQLPNIPLVHNWLDKMPADFGMMMNDSIEDCVIAAAGHARQVWTFSANPPEKTDPDAEILVAYEQWCGYQLNDPNTDNGCFEQTVLNNWYQLGLPLGGGGKDNLLMPPIEIDVRQLANIREAIYECGIVFIGFNVPAYLMDSTPPQLWDVDPAGDQTIIGGHAVVLAGYDTMGKRFDLVSWGQQYQMSVGFFREFCDEAYALISPDWIGKTGKTPLGLTTAQLEALARAV